MNRDQYFELQKRIIPAYIRVEQLPDEVKQRHKIKVGAKVPRYDGIAMYGNCKAFWELMNDKRQLVLYLNETYRNRLTNTASNPASRQADRYLQGKGSINVSSIYLTEYTTADGRRVGYGNPDPSPTYGKERKPSPFKGCRDGFIFLITPDWQTIEILVVADGSYNLIGTAKAMADGAYDEVLATYREIAAPIYKY